MQPCLGPAGALSFCGASQASRSLPLQTDVMIMCKAMPVVPQHSDAVYDRQHD